MIICNSRSKTRHAYLFSTTETQSNSECIEKKRKKNCITNLIPISSSLPRIQANWILRTLIPLNKNRWHKKWIKKNYYRDKLKHDIREKKPLELQKQFKIENCFLWKQISLKRWKWFNKRLNIEVKGKLLKSFNC